MIFKVLYVQQYFAWLRLNAKETAATDYELAGKMDAPIPAVVQQIENSELELASYIEEGSLLVTNVFLANENRENSRRDTDKRERDERLKAIEFESETANSKFTEINGQWPIILKQNDALEIHANSELQKSKKKNVCDQYNVVLLLYSVLLLTFRERARFD